MNFKTPYLHKIKIPLPPPEEQERMASMLDKFLEIIASFESGLPKLIELHKRQYEHYKEEILKPVFGRKSRTRKRWVQWDPIPSDQLEK